MLNTFQQKFLNWEYTASDTIDVKRIYIDMAEDLISGIMLSQIMFWHLPNKRGEQKLSVKQNNQYWLVKTYKEWLKECRVSRKQAIRGIEHLCELNLIIKEVHKFAGAPSVHIRINWEEFERKFNFVFNTVNSEEDIYKYWEGIKSKDGRSISNAENSRKSQKGTFDTSETPKVPKRNFTDEVKSQKGTFENPKKDISSTETTAEITNSEILYPIAEQSDILHGPITSLVKFEDTHNVPSVKMEELTSKEEVLKALGKLVTYAQKADSELSEVTPAIVAEFKRGCTKHKNTPCTCFHPKEKLAFNVVKEIIHILCSGAVDWAKEGKHVTKLVRNLVTIKYKVEDILYCMAWAYQVQKFDFYSLSSTSVTKLMPQFLDLKRTGRLKSSLENKHETNFDKGWNNLQNNKERILEDAMQKLAEIG